MSATLAQLTDLDYSREKIDLIKRTIAIGASDDELQLFLYAAKKTGLDPLTRQIYAVKRSGKMTIQTGIDGYRLIADRTGKLAGISDYIFDSEEGKNPGKATVTVKKALEGGGIADFTATARWGEYNAGGPIWQKMPFLMLGKCAEALALRKAFPADLSGVYTAEEMAQADNTQQGEAVFAEVERQKSAYWDKDSQRTEEPSVAVVPPELEWSYQKSSGVLICRIMEAKKTKKKKGEGELVTLKLNRDIDGQNLVFYFHATHSELLLSSVGKVVKLIVTGSGDFIHVTEVLQVDGHKIEPKVDGSVEAKARLLASVLNFEEEDLRELHTRYCSASWPETLVKLEAEKLRREGGITELEPA